MNVAILGANGFVGQRLFELWQRCGPHRPRAVVRSPSSLARVARFDAEWRLADARDAVALTTAFKGCEAVVHCVSGDDRVIAATIEPVVRAASAAGVQKLVFLSSAAVHGQNPPAGTNEESPLRDDQSLAYNNAKVRAENTLRRLCSEWKLDCAMLRPGIVYGPRSRWIVDVADALLAGRAYWIDGGHGACNAIFVDNLAHAIERALVTPDLPRAEAFLIGDTEKISWRQFYLAIAGMLGRTEADFHEAAPFVRHPVTVAGRLAALKSTNAVQRVLPLFSPRLKESVKAALTRWNAPPPADPWMLTQREPVPSATEEMTLLFACRTHLPHIKAAQTLGYRPPITFSTAMEQCARWLGGAGYPVVARK